VLQNLEPPPRPPRTSSPPCPLGCFHPLGCGGRRGHCKPPAALLGRVRLPRRIEFFSFPRNKGQVAHRILLRGAAREGMHQHFRASTRGCLAHLPAWAYVAAAARMPPLARTTAPVLLLLLAMCRPVACVGPSELQPVLAAAASPPPPPGSCGYSNVTALGAVNLGLPDFRHFACPSNQACLQACCGDPKCAGYTFTMYQPPTAVTTQPSVADACPTGSHCCWLKSAAGKPGTTPQANCTSALVVNPPGPPTPPKPDNTGDRPEGVDTATDCAMRRLAVEFAGSLRPDAPPLVHAALKLEELCNDSAPAEPIQARAAVAARPPRASSQGLPARTLHVDGFAGSDGSGDGSASKPFRSVEKAVSASRTLPGRTGLAVTIELGATTQPYELAAPLHLTAADSHLTIASAPGGKKATITGGRVLSPKWTGPVTLPGRSSGLRVYTAEGIAGNFTTMSVGGKRQVLARYPNADPETELYPAGTVASSRSGRWKMAPGGAPDKRVVIASPNRTEWVEHFGVSKSGGSMSAFYEYIDGGSAARFTPPICPGPGRTCCSNNFPYCGTPESVEISGKYVSAAVLSQLKSTQAPSPLLALHGWWTSPVWYNLVFGVSSVVCNASAAEPSLQLTFDRGGHQSSQGARSIDHWWLEGDLALLDTPGEWFHDERTQKLYYAVNSSAPPAEIVMSTLPSLVQTVGSQAAPVKNVTLQDLVLSRTASNFFAPFEALGGGDQAIERGGAVLAEGVDVRCSPPHINFPTAQLHRTTYDSRASSHFLTRFVCGCRRGSLWTAVSSLILVGTES
jgi:hypothetical protein